MNTATHRYFRLAWLSTFLALVAIVTLASNCRADVGAATQPDKTLAELQTKANAADAAAMYELGMAYQRGKLVELDLAKGRDWLEKAAAAGSIPAMNRLGTMYSAAEGGVTRDDAVAFDWFQKEANAGGSPGMLALGKCYADGRGVAKDADQAGKLYGRASRRPT